MTGLDLKHFALWHLHQFSFHELFIACLRRWGFFSDRNALGGILFGVLAFAGANSFHLRLILANTSLLKFNKFYFFDTSDCM